MRCCLLSPTERNTFITTAIQFASKHKIPTNNYLDKFRLSFHDHKNEEFVPNHYFDYSRYASIILKDFDLQHSNLKLINLLKPYIKHLNINIDFDRLILHQYYKIGLKPDYSSIEDVLYLSIQLVSINPTKEVQDRITIRYYFTPIKTYFKQSIFPRSFNADGFVLHVYYKDIESSVIALLESNRTVIENILGYSIEHINQDTVALLDMSMI